MVTLAAGCGGPSPDKTQETSTSASSSPASEPAAAAGGGSANELRPLSGPPRSNKYVQLGVTEAGFAPSGPPTPPGLRHYVVGLKGIGRSRGNDFLLEIQRFVFAQNERGCISHPERDATWLQHPFGESAMFTVKQPTEGEFAFLMPDDTQRVRVLIAPAGADGLVVPVGDEFTPTWPTPVQTIEDGSTLRVLVLANPTQAAALPPPAAGREHVVLDFVVENLTTTQGIEFTTSQQLRLEAPAGSFVQPSALTQQIACRLDDGDVVPPGHSRRLQAVYDVPAGTPLRLQYRGFEVEQTSVDLK